MYLGHIASRREDVNLGKRYMKAKGRVAGHAGRGRPKARWVDDILAL